MSEQYHDPDVMTQQAIEHLVGSLQCQNISLKVQCQVLQGQLKSAQGEIMRLTSLLSPTQPEPSNTVPDISG